MIAKNHHTFQILGETPMHLAAQYNHSSCIEALLKHESDAIHMVNNADMTPLQVSAILSLHDFLWTESVKRLI